MLYSYQADKTVGSTVFIGVGACHTHSVVLKSVLLKCLHFFRVDIYEQVFYYLKHKEEMFDLEVYYLENPVTIEILNIVESLPDKEKEYVLALLVGLYK